MKPFYIVLTLSLILANTLFVPHADARKQTEIFGYYTNKISSTGMSPTLSKGDCILSDSGYYEKHQVSRKDIVLFKSPKNDGTLWVRRVIGLPGEKITVRNGKVFIYAKELKEAYVLPNNNIKISKNINILTILGKNQYYVLGDNRDNSFDSRFFGPIELREIKAKVLKIYWSPSISRIGAVK